MCVCVYVGRIVELCLNIILAVCMLVGIVV